MKVIIICAVSLDGQIARNLKDPIDWTPKEDKKNFAKVTKKAGVIIMGRQTYETIGHPLRDRLNMVLTRETAAKKNQRGVIEFTNQKPRALLKSLSRRGFKTVFVIGGSQINSLFMKASLVSEIWLTLSPKIFGRAIGLFSKPLSQELKLFSVKKLSQGFLFLKYKVKK